jgi:predicted permease
VLEVLLVAALIAGSTAAGIVAEPRLPGHGQPVAGVLSKVIIWGFVPFISFFVVARLQLTAGVGVGALLAYLALAILGVVAWLLATRVLRLTRPQTGSLVVCVVLANTGYLGLPLVTALLGSDQLGYAIAYDSAVSAPMFFVVAMTIGAVMGTRETRSRRDLVAGLVRNPPLIAVVAGLIAPDTLAPDVLLDLAHAFVYAIIPLGFFIVGLSLGAESEHGQLTFPPALSTPIVTVLGLRLLAAPLLMIGLAAAVHDVPDAYLVQAAMPCGANAVVVAHLYGLDLKIASSAVAWSTMLVLVAAVVLAPFVT